MHRELESLLMGSKVLDSRAGYIRFLLAQHRIHAALEPSICGYPAIERALPDLPTRLKTAAIASDLRFFGQSPGPAGPAATIGGEARAWGALYVLEGSTLGASEIYRIVREHLGVSSEGGLRFLRWYDRQRARRWSDFLAALEDRGRGLPTHDLADGAALAFARARDELLGACVFDSSPEVSSPGPSR